MNCGYMKTIIATFLLSTTCFTAFGVEQEKGYAEWSVVYAADSSMSVNETKTVVHCHFSEDPIYAPQQIVFSINGSSNLLGALSATKEFTIHEPAGKYRFRFYAGELFQEITTDSVEIKPGMVTHIQLYFHFDGYIEEAAKPVIYLYPETTIDASVHLEAIGVLTFTYPQLNDNWKVTAQPDGMLTCDGKTYPYLFWEADQQVASPFESGSFEGFVVEGKNAVSFLEEKLTQIGLNDRERTDFITFWGPRLAANEFNNVLFQFNETCDAYATLDIVPQPENVNRLYIIWSITNASALDGMITPQELPVFDRSGFDVLEWGGVQILNAEL